MSDKDIALYQRVEQALERYVEIVGAMETQQTTAQALLDQCQSMLNQGKTLFKHLLELRRRLEQDQSAMADFREAVNRDCQGLRDGLELARSQQREQLAQVKQDFELMTAQLAARLEKAEQTTAALRRLATLFTIALAAAALAIACLALT